MSSIKGSAGKLTRLTKELSAKWGETKYYWNDSRSAAFEKEFLEELPSEVNTAVKIMEELNKVLTKIRRDCE